MVAAWHLILGDHGHWQHLGEWRAVMWIVIDGVWQWKGITMSLIQWLGQVQGWCNQTADALERQHMQHRESQQPKQEWKVDRVMSLGMESALVQRGWIVL